MYFVLFNVQLIVNKSSISFPLEDSMYGQQQVFSLQVIFIAVTSKVLRFEGTNH